MLRAGVLVKISRTHPLLKAKSFKYGFAGQAPHFGRSPYPHSFVLCSGAEENPFSTNYESNSTYKPASIWKQTLSVNPYMARKVGQFEFS